MLRAAGIGRVYEAIADIFEVDMSATAPTWRNEVADTGAVSRRGAPVRVLPPLLYAVPFLLAWLAEGRWPTTLGLGVAGRVLGLVTLVAGIGLMSWAALTFRGHRTTVIPWATVAALASTGPYRFTRNPIYLGDVLAYLGGALLIDSGWAIALLPVLMVATYRLVIRHEEAYLTTSFGRTYVEYRSRVRRWI